MKTYLVETVLGAVLLVIFVCVSAWQSTQKLSKADVDSYMSVLEKSIPSEWEERNEFLLRMRAWGENDDGQPVYMLNLMRFFEQNKTFLGGPSSGTPQEANEHYESVAKSLLLKLGAYPLISGETARIQPNQKKSNLIVHDPESDNWDRVLVVRYPGRRTFFALVTDPEYLKVMPYKLASLKVILTPVKGDLICPDLRWIVGGICLVSFLLVGWWRAAQRTKILRS